MTKKQDRLLTVTFERDEVTLLSHAVMHARREAINASINAKDLDQKVLRNMIKSYGDILNKLETAPWAKF